MPNFEFLYGPSLNIELNSSDSNTLFTTARRKQAINDAQEEFCDLTECLTRQSTVAVSCNTVEYALTSSAVLGSTDFTRLSPQGVEYRLVSSAGATLTRLAGEDFPDRSIVFRNAETPGWRLSTTPTTPTGYYLRPDGGSLVLGLDQRPLVGTSQTASLLVPYVARPAAMTSSGDLPFTVAGSARTDLTLYHRALPHFAASKLLMLTGDVPGSQAQSQLFQGYIVRYWQQQRPRGGTVTRLSGTYLRRRGGETVIPPSQWTRA